MTPPDEERIATAIARVGMRLRALGDQVLVLDQQKKRRDAKQGLRESLHFRYDLIKRMLLMEKDVIKIERQLLFLSQLLEVAAS